MNKAIPCRKGGQAGVFQLCGWSSEKEGTIMFHLGIADVKQCGPMSSRPPGFGGGGEGLAAMDSRGCEEYMVVEEEGGGRDAIVKGRRRVRNCSVVRITSHHLYPASWPVAQGALAASGQQSSNSTTPSYLVELLQHRRRRQLLSCNESDKGYTAKCIKCSIGAMRRALDRRAVFATCCVYLWDLSCNSIIIFLESSKNTFSALLNRTQLDTGGDTVQFEVVESPNVILWKVITYLLHASLRTLYILAASMETGQTKEGCRQHEGSRDSPVLCAVYFNVLENCLSELRHEENCTRSLNLQNIPLCQSLNVVSEVVDGSLPAMRQTRNTIRCLRSVNVHHLSSKCCEAVYLIVGREPSSKASQMRTRSPCGDCSKNREQYGRNGPGEGHSQLTVALLWLTAGNRTLDMLSWRVNEMLMEIKLMAESWYTADPQVESVITTDAPDVPYCRRSEENWNFTFAWPFEKRASMCGERVAILNFQKQNLPHPRPAVHQPTATRDVGSVIHELRQLPLENEVHSEVLRYSATLSLDAVDSKDLFNIATRNSHNELRTVQDCLLGNACLPPRRNGFNTPADSLRIFASGNRSGRCRWFPGFLGDLPFPQPFIPALLHTHLTLAVFQDPNDKNCPDLFIHRTASLQDFRMWESCQMIQLVGGRITYTLHEPTSRTIRHGLCITDGSSSRRSHLHTEDRLRTDEFDQQSRGSTNRTLSVEEFHGDLVHDTGQCWGSCVSTNHSAHYTCAHLLYHRSGFVCSDQVLRPHLLPFLASIPGAMFPQDNARLHTAQVDDCLRHVQTLPCPARSPDMSAMEHVWDQLKCQLRPWHSIRDLEHTNQQLCARLPQDKIRCLLDSMPDRLAACIAVREGATHCRRRPRRRITDIYAIVLLLCFVIMYSLWSLELYDSSAEKLVAAEFNEGSLRFERFPIEQGWSVMEASLSRALPLVCVCARARIYPLPSRHTIALVVEGMVPLHGLLPRHLPLSRTPPPPPSGRRKLFSHLGGVDGISLFVKPRLLQRRSLPLLLRVCAAGVRSV
ncbi:hypothetical protein PR048_017106 [Dryococelus australis]|uniref:Uncharacterized protein n=1 Tax=Dryococelus australis TaxID=614101 RepID=A0ABQ9H8K6_9NEOP|nr:hypothetical protein PR048_017106 [Dryococelus australis]